MVIIWALCCIKPEHQAYRAVAASGCYRVYSKRINMQRGTFEDKWDNSLDSASCDTNINFLWCLTNSGLKEQRASRAKARVRHPNTRRRREAQKRRRGLTRGLLKREDECFVVVWYENNQYCVYRVLYRVSYAQHSPSFPPWVRLLVDLLRACGQQERQQRLRDPEFSVEGQHFTWMARS